MEYRVGNGPDELFDVLCINLSLRSVQALVATVV